MKVKQITALLVAMVMLLPTAAMATKATNSFSDVPSNHWAYEYVTVLSNAGVISGYPDGTFAPDATVTRAEWAKMLSISANLPQSLDTTSFYADLDPLSWYAPYIKNTELYLPHYYTEDDQPICLPEDTAIREDVAISIVIAKGYIWELADLSLVENFADADTISEDFAALIASAVEKGLLNGFDDNTLRPQESLTRAEAAALLCRAFYSENEATIDPAQEAEIKEIVESYNSKVMAFDQSVLDIVVKEGAFYNSLLSELDLDTVVNNIVESMGLPEKYNDRLFEMQKDNLIKLLSKTSFDIQTVVIEGDIAKVSTQATAITLDKMGEVTDYMTDAELDDLISKATSMTEDEFNDFTVELMIKKMPEMLEVGLANSSKDVSLQVTILQKIDGKWLISESR